MKRLFLVFLLSGCTANQGMLPYKESQRQIVEEPTTEPSGTIIKLTAIQIQAVQNAVASRLKDAGSARFRSIRGAKLKDHIESAVKLTARTAMAAILVFCRLMVQSSTPMILF